MSTDSDRPGTAPPGASTTLGAPRRRARSIEAAAIAGVVYGVLTLVSLYLFNRSPGLSLAEEELTAWYDDAGNRQGLLLGLNLAAISSIAFLWFVAVLRRRIGDREDKFFSTVFFGSAIAYVVSWLLAAAMVAAPAVAVTLLDAATVSPSSATLAGGEAAAVLLVVAPRLQAVFVLSTTTIVLRTGVLPRWFAMIGYLVGLVLMLVPVISRPIGVTFPIWVLATSIALLIARPPERSLDESVDTGPVDVGP